MEDTILKTCPRCRVSKPASAYYIKRRGKETWVRSRLSSYCKPCSSQTNSEWHKANKEKYQKRKKEWEDTHKDSRRESATLRRANNRGRINELWRNARLEKYDKYRHKEFMRRVKRYGITAENYEMKVLEQGGKCAICLKAPDSRGLSIDHDHGSGVVRGLLCNRCNMGIGYFHDDPERMEKAIAYLRRSRSNS